MKTGFGLLKEAIIKWSRDAVPRHAATVAFYTILSLVPMLLVVVALAGYLLGPAAAEGKVLEKAKEMVGPEAAGLIQNLLLNAGLTGSGIWATLIGLTIALYGASNVFHQLKHSLDVIWGVIPQEAGVKHFILSRLIAVAMVLLLALLLQVWLVLDTILAVVSHLMSSSTFHWVPWGRMVHLLVSWIVLTLLFGLLYKALPHVRIGWRDVWHGAWLAALLFTLTKGGVGWYIGISGLASVYGAAGALVVLLLWVYFSTQIFFFGAEMTYVYATRFGSLAGKLQSQRLQGFFKIRL